MRKQPQFSAGKTKASVAWFLPVLLTAYSGAVAAQEETPPIFVDRVEVNVVNIEVFVTDKDGRPVAGLTEDDFEVFEDGNPVEITNFFTVEQPEVLEEIVETGELPERSIQSAGPKLLPADQRLNLVVYVDQFNLRPFNRNRVLESLEEFLENRIRSGDNVMLVSAYRGAEIVQPFTRDRQAVIDGLREMQKQSTYRQMDEARIRQTIRSMQIAAGQGRAKSARAYLRSYVQEAQANVRRSAMALRDSVRSLGGLPGRKAFLYVSEGLPQRPGDELYQQLQAIFGTAAGLQDAAGPGEDMNPSSEALAEDQTRLFGRVVREANAHQVTFYTFDATGSTGTSHLSAEAGGTLISGSGGRTAFDAVRQHNLQQPLIEMAETTGGRSVLNTFDFDDALDDVAANFDVFYSLGYSPPEGGDDEFHRIEVRLKNDSGLRVRHRTGYVDKRPEERIADRTVSTLVFDLEKNPLGVAIEFGRAEKQGRDKYHLPVLVRIPIRGVTLLPNGEHEEGRLKIFVAVKDDEGAISDLHTTDYPVRIPHASLDEARGKEIGHTLTLLVRGGLPKVAVGVWDELSGVDAFVHKQVRVGGNEGSG
ncbi:MAG: VWA domain-containing protein [bacterium]|nr:VWA domain-containing protein [bacterium]